MSKEIFVIYNKTTGFLDGGAGKIDREWDDKNKDGSTISENIPKILAKDINRAVIYFPNQNIPDFDNYKIQDGKIVLKTEQDKLPTQDEIIEEKIQVEIRKIAIENLKASGDLPIDYKGK